RHRPPAGGGHAAAGADGARGDCAVAARPSGLRGGQDRARGAPETGGFEASGTETRGGRCARHGRRPGAGRARPPGRAVAVITASRWTRIRLVACGAIFGGLFFAVGKRAFTLQVAQADHLKAMAEEQYLREIELPPRRGRILDRNGAELASTADVDSIYCNPRRLPDVRDAARRLGRALGLDWRDLEK